MRNSSRHSIFFASFILIISMLATPAMFGQSLSLSSGSSIPGGVTALTLTLANTSGQVSALGFTLGFDPLEIGTVNVAAGAASAAAGKSIDCNITASSAVCVVYGLDGRGIPDGVVADITLSALATSVNPLRSISVNGVTAANAAASSLNLTASGGAVAVSYPTVGVTNVACSPSTVPSGASTTCTVDLSGTVNLASAVALTSSNNTALPVPASAPVAIDTSITTFTVTAGAVTASTPVSITASFNGTSMATSVTVTPLPRVSSLSCTPGTFSTSGSSTCTVTVANMGSTGVQVNLASNNTTVTVPASVPVNAGQTTATFTASVGTFTADATATLAATLNGSTANATIQLSTPVVLSSLACTPTSLGSGAKSTCTVTLSKAVAASTSVTLASSAATQLSVPAAVSVASGQATATFSATAATLTADSSAIVTATYAGVSKTVSISLVTTISPSSLTCSPASLTSGASSTCTVTLSKAATADTVVAVSDNNATLTVPTSATVLSGQSSATFTAAAGTVSADATATVTVTLNGTSRTATISLVAPVAISSLACTPNSLSSGATATCTVSMSKAVAADTSVSVSDSSTLLSVPAAVTVLNGQSSAVFPASASTVASNSTVTVTAALNGASKSTSITLTAPVVISGLVAAYAMNEGTGTILTDVSGNGNHGVIYGATWINNGRYGKGLAFDGKTSYVNLGNSAALRLSSSMTISAWVWIVGKSSTDNQIVAKADSTGGWQLKVTQDTGVRTFGVAVSPNSSSSTLRYSQARPTSNKWFHVAGVYDATARTMSIYVNGALTNGTLRGVVPPSQWYNLNQPVTIGRKTGGSYFNGVIDETRIYNRALTAAEVQADMKTALPSTPSPVLLSVNGSPRSNGAEPMSLRFAASNTDAGDVTISADGLPAGAQFDRATGDLTWTPAGATEGTYPVTVTATNSLGDSDSKQVLLQVSRDSNTLSLNNLETDCVSGGISALRIKAAGTEAADVRVLVNGEALSPVAQNEDRVQFACPQLPAGTPLSIQMQRGSRTSNTLETSIALASPAILPTGEAREVKTGSVYEFLATGLSEEGLFNAQLRLAIAGTEVAAEALPSGLPGMWRIVARIPADLTASEEALMSLQLTLPTGRKVESDSIAVAITAESAAKDAGPTEQ